MLSRVIADTRPIDTELALAFEDIQVDFFVTSFSSPHREQIKSKSGVKSNFSSTEAHEVQHGHYILRF